MIARPWLGNRICLFGSTHIMGYNNMTLEHDRDNSPPAWRI